jgi:hypothetical protein
MALEEDNELFSALLAPMVRFLAVPSPPKPQLAQWSQGWNFVVSICL